MGNCMKHSRPAVPVLVFLGLAALPASASTFYISPTGSDSNAGTTEAKPFKTFAYAINSARASCGDTLLLLNGTYGDGTTTGKILVSGLVCTSGNELIIRAQNQRRAKIYDSGIGVGVDITDSAYIVIDGLYSRSA